MYLVTGPFLTLCTMCGWIGRIVCVYRLDNVNNVCSLRASLSAELQQIGDLYPTFNMSRGRLIFHAATAACYQVCTIPVNCSLLATVLQQQVRVHDHRSHKRECEPLPSHDHLAQWRLLMSTKHAVLVEL